MKRILFSVVSALCAISVLLGASAVSAGALVYKNDVQTKCKSILLVNTDMDQVVFEKAADERRYPASTTKIMTFIVAYEHIDDLETRIPIKKTVIDQLKGTGSSMSSIENHIGDNIKAIDLFYSMMVPSGNDAAMVLADYVGGGDIDKFVQMMNDKAQELGCKDTHYMNPDGLHHKDHYTTARDMYLITKYALTLDHFSDITDTTEYTVEGDEYPIHTTNYLIDPVYGGNYYYTYAHGIKTGTTDEAGRCLVTTATEGGNTYMAVLLGAPYKEGELEEYYTFEDAAALFRWALVKLDKKTVKTTSTPICETKLKLAWGKDKITLVPEKNLMAVLPADVEDKNIIVESNVDEVLSAPLYTDKPVGTATVYYVDNSGDKQEIATVNLVPAEQVDKSGILAVLDVIGTIFQSYWFIIVIGFIIIVMLIYVIAAKIHRKRVKARRKVKKYRNF